MILFRKKHIHEYESVGYFYKEHYTEYRNDFDQINAYQKYRCKTCEKIMDVLLSSESFLPEMYEHKRDYKDKYIQYLKSNGFKSEIELVLEEKK